MSPDPRAHAAARYAEFGGRRRVAPREPLVLMEAHSGGDRPRGPHGERPPAPHRRWPRLSSASRVEAAALDKPRLDLPHDLDQRFALARAPTGATVRLRSLAPQASTSQHLDQFAAPPPQKPRPLRRPGWPPPTAGPTPCDPGASTGQRRTAPPLAIPAPRHRKGRGGEPQRQPGAPHISGRHRLQLNLVSIGGTKRRPKVVNCPWKAVSALYPARPLARSAPGPGGPAGHLSPSGWSWVTAKRANSAERGPSRRLAPGARRRSPEMRPRSPSRPPPVARRLIASQAEGRQKWPNQGGHRGHTHDSAASSSANPARSPARCAQHLRIQRFQSSR